MSVSSIHSVPETKPSEERAAGLQATSSAIRRGFERTEEHTNILKALGLMPTPEVTT